MRSDGVGSFMAEVNAHWDDLLLVAMRSVTGPKACRYAAGPLTSGRDFVEAQAARLPIDSERLRAKNQERLTAFVATLRSSSPAPVIDPGLLQVPGWGGAAYSTFFLRVIDELCFEVWLLDGWAFSRGVTKEVLFAFDRGIPCFDQSGERLTVTAAVDGVDQAISVTAAAGVDAAVLMRRRERLAGLLRP